MLKTTPNKSDICVRHPPDPPEAAPKIPRDRCYVPGFVGHLGRFLSVLLGFWDIKNEIWKLVVDNMELWF